MSTWLTVRPVRSVRSTLPQWSNSSLNDPFFNEAFNWVFGNGKSGGRTRPADDLYSVKMNVAQDENNYYVYAILPGVNPDKLEISALENKLTIAGEIEPAGFGPHTQPEVKTGEKPGEKTEGETQEQTPKLQWLLNELPNTGVRFHRELTLPSHISADEVQAFYDNGILRLIVPQVPQARPRRISVTSAAPKNEQQQ